MRPFHLRALLLTLAVVFQTVAGGVGAGSAMGPGDNPFYAHCQTVSGKTDGAADTRQDGGPHHRCESCCPCVGQSPLCFGSGGPVVVAPQAFQTAHDRPLENRRVPSRSPRTHLARGPPFEAARA